MGAAYKQFPSIVQLLVDQGAVIDIWNAKNEQSECHSESRSACIDG